MTARTIGRTADGHEIKFGTAADLAALTNIIDATVQFWRDDGAKFRSNGAGGWIQTRIAGATLVATTKPGIARHRWVDVAHNTLPVEATSGVFKAFAPGIKNVWVDSVRISAGTIPLTTTNFRVRFSIDSPDDGIDALLLPITEPTSDGDADIGQVRSFNLTPVLVSTTLLTVILPQPILLYDGDDPILRVGFVHNLGTGVTVQLGLSAEEEV